MRPPRPRQNHPAGWGCPRRTRGQLRSRCSFCEDVAPCWQLRKVTAGAGLAAWRRGAQGDPPPGEPACDVNKGRTCPLSAQSERPEGSSPGVTLSTSRGFSLPRAAQGGATGSAPRLACRSVAGCERPEMRRLVFIRTRALQLSIRWLISWLRCQTARPARGRRDFRGGNAAGNSRARWLHLICFALVWFLFFCY